MADRTYLTEFPEFANEQMPDLTGWKDESWRNDACPVFYSPGGNYRVWIDRADVKEREFQHDVPRFSLQYLSKSVPLTDEAWVDCIESDDWDEVLTALKG